MSTYQIACVIVRLVAVMTMITSFMSVERIFLQNASQEMMESTLRQGRELLARAQRMKDELDEPTVNPEGFTRSDSPRAEPAASPVGMSVERFHSLHKKALAIAIGFGLALGSLLFFGSAPIAGMFTSGVPSQPDALTIARVLLRLLGANWCLAALLYVAGYLIGGAVAESIRIWQMPFWIPGTFMIVGCFTLLLNRALAKVVTWGMGDPKLSP